MIEYKSFGKLSQERGSGFNLYFVWPVFSKNVAETVAKLPNEMISDGTYRILLTDEKRVSSKDRMLFGIDFLLEQIEGEEYAVAFGVINKSSWRDLIAAQQLLRNLDLNTVPARADFLYEFLRDKKNYEGYVLREYRSGATKLQSYFKDDNITDDHRLIYEKLENDWSDGLRPYKATLRKPGTSIRIQIDGRGVITMPIVPEDTDALNNLIKKMIRDHITIREMVSRAKFEKLEIRNLNLFGHSNLVVRLRTPIKFSQPNSSDDSIKEDDTVESFIGYLEELAGVYGKSMNVDSCSFNLLYGDGTDSQIENRFSSSFSIDIMPSKILVSPTFQPMLQDLLNLYFAIDRFFQVEPEAQIR